MLIKLISTYHIILIHTLCSMEGAGFKRAIIMYEKYAYIQ